MSRAERQKLRIRTNRCNSITNKTDMINYLRINPNGYNNYILDLYTRLDVSHVIRRPSYEDYHIFPLHLSGPHVS